MSIKTEWLKGVNDPKEREKEKKIIENSNFLLDKLKEICYNKLTELENVNKSDYDNPSWAYKQAHVNGEKQAYRSIIELCTIRKN
tara:strand:- start:59 stop:313 length:255 start_codon:yes stop_codon:yes gene_type:complete